MPQVQNFTNFQSTSKDLAISSTSSPTTPPAGTLATGATPYIRENSLNFAAAFLRPQVKANLFFDTIKVNGFSQRGIPLYVTQSSYVTNGLYNVNDGIFGTTSYAYGEILTAERRTSGADVMYLNTNFLSFKIQKSPTAAAFTSTTFAIDDIVYQTPTGAVYTWAGNVQNYSFYGKVKRWYRIDDNYGILVVDPYEGKANSYLDTVAAGIGSANSYLRSDKYSDYANVVFVASNNRFQRGENLLLKDGSTITTVYNAGGYSNSYISLSGVVPTVNGSNLKTILINSNNYVRDGISDLVGNNIYIVSGTNQGYFDKIISVNDFKYGTDAYYKEVLLQNTLPQRCDSNTVYSIGEPATDERGTIAGVFHVPSYAAIKWPCGTRIFSILDADDARSTTYTMRAAAGYTASPSVDTTENARNSVLSGSKDSPVQEGSSTQIQGTYVVNDRKFMSQTFFTPKKNEIVNGTLSTNYGIFVSSIDLFFYSKPTTSGELLPFSVGITKVANGLPVDTILAECTLHQEMINVSSYIDGTGNTVPGIPTSANVSTMTKFKFDDPVYLEPETEYAIRLHTESPDYQVWTAQVGSLVADANGNDRRVSEQPYVGNFFTAQNASNWNPIENQDLMFNINRAVFSSSSTFDLKVDPGYLQTNVFADMIKLTTADQTFTPTTVKYQVISKLLDGSTAATVEVKNTEIYDFGSDIDISSTASKRRRLIKQNTGDDLTVRVTLTTSDDSVAPILNKERSAIFALQNIINNAGIANNLIQMTNKGSGYVSGTTTVTISAPDDLINGTQATADVPASLIGSSGEINAINITNPGSGYYTTPTITIAGAGTGATAIINGETDTMGGNILAKYQTKIVSLEDGFESGDLIVRLDAFRPSGTDIQVYFKVLSAQDTDVFTDKKWKRMLKVNDNYSPTTRDKTNLEYRYNIDTGYIQYIQDGNSYPLGGEFKYFAIKLRLVAQDPSVTPAVDTLKVLAVPGG